MIHAAAYNLGLVMRAIFGQGTPKGMADALGRLIFGLLNLFVTIFTPPTPLDSSQQTANPKFPYLSMTPCPQLTFYRNRGFSTGC